MKRMPMEGATVMKRFQSPNQPLVSLGSILKVSALGIFSSLVFGLTFRTGYRVEQQAVR
jgi:hypothetical protein